MKKNTVKKIFIFFLVFLPLQYAMVGIVGLKASEPWPAFVFPAFQNIDNTPKYVAVENAVLLVSDPANGISQKVLPEKLFSGIHESQLQGFLRTHFKDSLRWVAKAPESREWLAAQIRESYPVLKPGALHVQWVKTYFNFSSAATKIDSTRLINEFSVPLNDGSH